MVKLKGMIVPVATPFMEDEAINYPTYKQLIEFLLGNKVHEIGRAHV